MAITALHHIRALGGHTKPHLMLCEDGNAYIVKLRHNPQGCRALASEYLATKLAQWANLPMPPCSIISVSHFLIRNTRELSSISLPDNEHGCGMHFGSCLVGNRPGDTVTEYLPGSYLAALNIPSIFGGMLALDKWVANTDTRQAVFMRKKGRGQYGVHFIDQSQCFAGSKWQFTFDPTQGLLSQPEVYLDIKGWDSFEPFIETLMSASPTLVWTIAQDIPPEWYDGRRGDLEALVESLLRRRSNIYTLVARQLACTPELFPQWSRRMSVYMPSGHSLGGGLHPVASSC